MSLQNQITQLAQTAGTQIGALKRLVNDAQADLSALTTTDKTNLVAALNEIKAGLDAVPVINDGATSASSLWSSNRIAVQITAAIDALVNGAPGTLDTLNELAAALNDNPDVITDMLAQQAKRVAVNAAQTFTTAEKLQGCNNLGVGDPEHDFAGDFNTAMNAQ